MDNPINRAEHEEFSRRMEDEHRRLSHRLSALETRSEQLNSLALSVQELAVSIRTMTEEQHEQSERLTQLEDKDGEMWRKVVSHTVTVIIGILIGFVFKQIGM